MVKRKLQTVRKSLQMQKKDLEQGEQDLEDGKKEYEDSKKEAEDEIADNEKKLSDAREELETLEQPRVDGNRSQGSSGVYRLWRQCRTSEKHWTGFPCDFFPGGSTDQSDHYDPYGRGAENPDRNLKGIGI